MFENLTATDLLATIVVTAIVLIVIPWLFLTFKKLFNPELDKKEKEKLAFSIAIGLGVLAMLPFLIGYLLLSKN